MTVTLKSKTDIVVPSSLRRRAGIKPGDQLEVRVSRGVIHILPKLPLADDQYTPAERRIVDARLDESEEELRSGRTAGPFTNAGEMIARLKKQLRKQPESKPAKRSR